MLSLDEQAGRRVPFHPKVTLVRGTNDTGKSSLIKTLYRTFGATPAIVHRKWKEARVRSLVVFKLDGQQFVMLHNEGLYCLFDADGKRLIKTRHVTKELAPFFADFFSFRLQLQSRSADTQATPAFLFLPFYVDQDAGWAKNWSSFVNLGQFKNWRRDVVEYHVGLRPNEYYELKSGLTALQEEERVLRERRSLLERVLKDLLADLARITFDIDIEAYRSEVERLLVVCARLQRQEVTLKTSLTRIYNARMTIEAQLKITTAAATELGRDYSYAVAKMPDEVECPTCGTTHFNSFADRFAIARDEARCRELAAELDSDLSRLREEADTLTSKYSATTADLEEARSLLNQRQGDVTLQQLIENEGKKSARAIVEGEIAAVDREVGRTTNAIVMTERRMENLQNAERRFAIQTQYLNRMRRFVQTLSVPNLFESQFKQIAGAITESGSDLPRGLLAYYYAILQTIAENPAATYMPIVLDSPRQQDQDDENWLAMLRFLRDEQPEGSQLILALREHGDVDFGGGVIDLNDKNQVLHRIVGSAWVPATSGDVGDLSRRSSSGNSRGNSATASSTSKTRRHIRSGSTSTSSATS